jgi:hypothetical protein
MQPPVRKPVHLKEAAWRGNGGMLLQSFLYTGDSRAGEMAEWLKAAVC